MMFNASTRSSIVGCGSGITKYSSNCASISSRVRCVTSITSSAVQTFHSSSPSVLLTSWMLFLSHTSADPSACGRYRIRSGLSEYSTFSILVSSFS